MRRAPDIQEAEKEKLLASHVSQRDSLIGKLELENEILSRKQVALQNEIDLLKTELKFVSEQRHEYKIEAGTMRGKFEVLMKNFADLELSHLRISDQLLTSQALNDNLTSMLNAIRNQADHSSQNLIESLSNLQAEMQDVWKKHEAERLELYKLQEEVTVLTSTNHAIRLENDKSILDLKQAEKNIAELEANLQRKIKFEHECSDELLRNKVRIAELEGSNRSLEESLYIIQNELSKSAPSGTKMALFISRINRLESTKSQLEAESNEFRKQRDDYRRSSAKYENENARLSSIIKAKENNIVLLNLTISKMENISVRYNASSLAMNTRLNELQIEIKNYKNKIIDLQSLLISKDTIIADLQKQLMSETAKNNDMTSASTVAANNVKDITISMYTEYLKNLQEKFNKLLVAYIRRDGASHSDHAGLMSDYGPYSGARKLLTNKDIEVLLANASLWDPSCERFYNDKVQRKLKFKSDLQPFPVEAECTGAVAGDGVDGVGLKEGQPPPSFSSKTGQHKGGMMSSDGHVAFSSALRSGDTTPNNFNNGAFDGGINRAALLDRIRKNQASVTEIIEKLRHAIVEERKPENSFLLFTGGGLATV